MAVQVEIYREGSKTKLTALKDNRVGNAITPEDEIRMIEARKMKKSAKVLGLRVLMLRLRGEIEAIKIRSSQEIKCPLMTPEERAIWRAFLPMTYTSSPQRRFNIRAISSYSFDQPPMSVLETWADLRAKKVFDIYEIWTPERVQRPDPILVGFKGLAQPYIGPFLIARWGESLAPYDEIKKKVESSNARRRRGPVWDRVMR